MVFRFHEDYMMVYSETWLDHRETEHYKADYGVGGVEQMKVLGHPYPHSDGTNIRCQRNNLNDSVDP